MARPYIKKLLIISFYFFIFSFLVYNSLSYLDPDLGWHLEVGKTILEEKSVPNLEQYNFPLAGRTWVDHEWLMDAITYCIYSSFGYTFLVIVYALLMVLTLALLAFYTQKYFLKNQDGWFIILFFQFLGVLSMAPHLGVRIQELALINLLLTIIIIHHYSRTKNFTVLFWLFPLFYFWANAHASYLIGLFVLFSWIGVKLVEINLKRFGRLYFFSFDDNLNYKNVITFALFALLALSTTLITPYGLSLYSFLIEYSNTFYLTHIAEWVPIWHYPFNYYELFYLAICLASIFLIISSSIKKELIQGNNESTKTYKINMWQLFLCLLFLVMAFKSKRHFPLFFVVFFPVLAEFNTSYFCLPSGSFPLLRSIKDNVFLVWMTIATILLAAASIFLVSNFTNQPFTSPVFCKSFPCASIEYIKNSPYRDFKIFNNYGWGGYIIKVWPDKKIFIDGRLPIIQLNNHSFLEEYYDFFAEETLEKKLAEYNIKLILLKIYPVPQYNWFEKFVLGLSYEKNDDPRGSLEKYLADTPDWKLIYHDDIGQVYIKE